MRQAPPLMHRRARPRREQAIYQQYARAARATAQATGAVTILVSHRFSTARKADLVVVRDSGSITEMGTHEELLAQQGLSVQMFTLQARALQRYLLSQHEISTLARYWSGSLRRAFDGSTSRWERRRDDSANPYSPTEPSGSCGVGAACLTIGLLGAGVGLIVSE